MDALPTARSKEDIALDLLKFVATTAHIGGKAASSTGFAAPASSKPEDQLDQLFELYTRCREAVEAPLSSAPVPTSRKA